MTEQEELELREQAERGRRAQIVLDFMNEFILYRRAIKIREIEGNEDFSYKKMLQVKIGLMELRELENWINSIINTGEIAEKELNENGK